MLLLAARMYGGCPNFWLFYALPRDATCKCTSEFTRRAAHSELLCFVLVRVVQKLRLASELSRRGLGGVLQSCFLSRLNASVSIDTLSSAERPDLQVLCPPEASVGLQESTDTIFLIG